MTVSSDLHAPPLPPPPRPLTPEARRRTWLDPHVRFWWVAAAALLLGGAWACGAQYFAWRRDLRLVQQPPTMAEVVMADGERIPGRKKPPSVVVRLAFTHEGKPREVSGFLDGRAPGDFVAVGDKVSLRVDPNDPTVWTARSQPRKLRGQLLGGATALILAVGALMAAARLRRGVARTFAQGEMVEALVVGESQSAIAPRSRAVRATPADGSHNRVFTVYVPLSRSGSHPTDGEEGAAESLWVIRPAGRGRPLAAAWFEA